MDNRIKNTKKLLLKALVDLSNDESIHDITVTKLCRRANVNRTTFYKYYSIPADILTEFLIKSWNMAKINIIESDEVIKDDVLYEKILLFCKFYEENKDEIKLYFQVSNNPFEILEYFLEEKLLELKLDKYQIYFVSGGILSILRKWCFDDFDLDSKLIAGVITELILKL